MIIKMYTYVYQCICSFTIYTKYNELQHEISHIFLLSSKNVMNSNTIWVKIVIDKFDCNVTCSHLILCFFSKRLLK